MHGDDDRVMVEDCIGSVVGYVDFVDVPDSGRSLEIFETESWPSEAESWIWTCFSLGDGADLGILADGRVRGVEVSLGATSFGVAESLILLCGAAAKVAAPLEGAPSFLY